ncbi:hypothetical protein HMPREF9499_00851, partial [Enterococcus faecalis TX0012]
PPPRLEVFGIYVATFVNDRIGAGALGRRPYSIYKSRNNP